MDSNVLLMGGSRRPTMLARITVMKDALASDRIFPALSRPRSAVRSPISWTTGPGGQPYYFNIYTSEPT